MPARKTCRIPIEKISRLTFDGYGVLRLGENTVHALQFVIADIQVLQTRQGKYLGGQQLELVIRQIQLLKTLQIADPVANKRQRIATVGGQWNTYLLRTCRRAESEANRDQTSLAVPSADCLQGRVAVSQPAY